MHSDTCYILDLSSMMWRAWHVAKSGQVSSSFIFCRMLLAILKETHPHFVVAAEDCSSSRVVRKRIYSDYKNKPRDPEEMKSFFVMEAEIKRILDVMLIPRVHYPGYEADDVIASLVHVLPVCHDFAFVIVTADKDLFQLIADHVSLHDLSSKKLLDANGAFDAKGVWPYQMREVLALTGDASDNVPGVPGIGIKTAVKLLEKYGTLHAVLKSREELSPKLRDKLSECVEQVLMAYELVQLYSWVPVPVRLLRIEYDDSWKKRVSAFFKELGFGREIIGDLNVSL